MPKVEFRKARKDYPSQGIAKGDQYYFWELKTGPRTSITYRSKSRPLPEQLTTSEYLQTAYPLEREINACEDGDALEDLKEQVEALRDETQEKLDNMPEGLQQGDTGQILQERIDNCESAISELDGMISDWEEFVGRRDEREERRAAKEAAAKEAAAKEGADEDEKEEGADEEEDEEDEDEEFDFSALSSISIT